MNAYSKSTLRAPLARVRGLGSAKSGSHHWWIERMTSLALVPLSVWFLAALVRNLLGAPREAVAAWLSSPITALLMAVFTVVMFIHTRMGLKVVIEDYVHSEGRKIALLLVKDACVYALLGGALAAIAQLHFNGL